MEILIEDRQAALAVDKLSALAHPHRLAVFRALVRAGMTGLAAGEIAERLEIPSSSLSFHLSHLRNAGLVIDRRAGRSIIYRANFDSMTALVGYLLEECCSESGCGGSDNTAKGSKE